MIPDLMSPLLRQESILNKRSLKGSPIVSDRKLSALLQCVEYPYFPPFVGGCYPVPRTCPY